MRASRQNTTIHVLALLLLLLHSSIGKDEEESLVQCLIGCDMDFVECGIECVMDSAVTCFITCLTAGSVDPALCIETCGLTILQCFSSCTLPVPFLGPGSGAKAPEASIRAAVAAAVSHANATNNATSMLAPAIYLPLPPMLYSPPYLPPSHLHY